MRFREDHEMMTAESRRLVSETSELSEYYLQQTKNSTREIRKMLLLVGLLLFGMR